MKRTKREYTKTGFMKGIIILMFSQVVIKIVGLIYKLYLTNKQGFGDEGNAIYSAGFQIYALLLTISSIGVPNAISKLVSSNLAAGNTKGAYRIFKIAFALFGLLGFSGTLVLFFGADVIATNYLQIPEAKMTLIALSPSVFLVSIASVLRGYFNGRENITVTANSQSIEQILKTLFTVIVVEIVANISNSNTTLMAAGATVATTLATMFSLFYLYIYYRNRKKIVWQEVVSSKYHKKERIITIVKSILYVTIPISISSLLSVATKSIDAFTIVRILKEQIGEQAATIQYGILSGKVETLITLPFSFNIALATALVPGVASYIASGRWSQAKRRIEFSILVTVLIGLPCAAIMGVFAEPILQILFPNASSGATMLALSSIGIIFVVLIQTVNGALQGMGKVLVPVIALALGMVIKLTLNTILIPIEGIGINGAIISTIVSQVIPAIICFTTLKRSIDLEFKIGKFITKPILATIGMTICSYSAYKYLITNMILITNTSFIMSALLGIIIYILLIIVLKVLSEDDIFMFPYGEKIYKVLKRMKIY